jgi:predicted phosphodiesterase
MLKIPKTIKNHTYCFVLAAALLILMASEVSNAEWTAYNDCMSWSGDGTHQNATKYTIYDGETSNTSGLLKDIDTGSTTGMPTVIFTMNENIPVQGPGIGTTESLFSGTDAYDVFNGKVDFRESSSGGDGVVYYGSRVGWWVDITFDGLDPDKIYTFVGTAIRGNSGYTNRFTRCTIIGAEYYINNSSGDTVNGGARVRSADVTELLTGDNSSSTTGFVIRWDYITVADEGSGTGSFKVRTEATGDSQSNYKAYPLGGFMLEEVGDIGNLPPMVYADGDKAYWLPSAIGDVDIKFDADVDDDGLPVNPGEVTTTWSVEDKPSGSTVTFDDSSIVDVTATFDTAGDYVLRLTADDDGQTYYWDEVKVTIYAHDATSPSFEKGPYLMYTGVNTEMDVLWQIDKFATCFLKWGENQSLDPPDGSVYTNEVSLGTYGHQHIYTITGLDTDTKYYYKIEAGVGEGVYETGSFRTAPAASATDIKFLAYGDTRTQEDKHNDVCEEMVETYTNRDSGYKTFLLHAGDWVYDGDLEGDWSEFFYRSDSPPYYASISELQANLPIQGCMGNHEEHGGLFIKYFPYWYFGDSDRYGLFEYGPVRVVVADQYAEGSYSSSNKMGTTQVNWIKNQLSDSSKMWNFLLFHQPLYTAGPHYLGLSPLKSEMEDLFVNQGNVNEDVDIVFAGHNHNYARCYVDDVTHITTGGGGAPLGDVDSGGNIKVSVKEYHFCEIDIRDNILYFIARNESGSIIDAFALAKDGTPETWAFIVKDSSGNAVAWFDNLGNLALKGDLDEESTHTANGSNDEFRVQDSGSNDVAIIDSTDGNMYIDGFLYQEQDMSLLSPEGFIVKNSSGDAVAFIDDSGNVYLQGALFDFPD